MTSRVFAAIKCFLKGNRRTTSICVLLVIVLAPISRVDATDKLDLAIQHIESLGGQIKRDEKLPGHPVTEINLDYAKITDAGLKELSGFRDLKSLSLGNTKITNAGLKELGGVQGPEVS